MQTCNREHLMASRLHFRIVVFFVSLHVVFWVGFKAGRYAQDDASHESLLPESDGRLDVQRALQNKDVPASREVAKQTAVAMETCEPVKRLVFVKTHKTASTTTASIIERFGYTRNLSFVVPPDRKYGPHILSSNRRFTRAMIADSPLPLHGAKHYDMLTNHVRYNRPEMDAVIPNATYVTIVRHPVKHFESGFGYFGWGKSVGQADDKLAKFMENPRKYLNDKGYFWFQSHNGQLFDLGMDTDETDDDKKVDAKIQALDDELDLVLVADYFDESLLVLKKQLCWTWNDILYIPNGVRSNTHRKTVADDARQKILAWNKSDFKLYQHFNKSLWQKIEKYGTSFENDLTEFRQRQQTTMNECIDRTSFEKNDAREQRYKLRTNASELCRNLWRGDVTFTAMLRDRQLEDRIVHPPKH